MCYFVAGDPYEFCDIADEDVKNHDACQNDFRIDEQVKHGGKRGAGIRQQREGAIESGCGDDEGEGHGRIAGVELQAKEVGKARKHHDEQHLGKHRQCAGECYVGGRLDGEVSGERKAHGSGVDAEQRTGSFFDRMLDVACSDQD